VTIQAASVTTGNAQRDGHLKTPDFFDIESYPTITFVSTSVERDGTDWNVTGDLTINATTKPVTIVFEETGTARDPFGNLRAGFEGSVTINRTDWGLAFNAALETGGVLVSEKVTLEFDVSAIRTPAV
jgi:polyisoprenoid-binding protein YceI